MSTNDSVTTAFHFDRATLRSTLWSAHEFEAARVLDSMTPSQWEELREQLNHGMQSVTDNAIVAEEKIRQAVADIAETDGTLNAARGVMAVSHRWESGFAKASADAFEGISTEVFAGKLLDSLRFEKMAEMIEQWGKKNGKNSD